jgi:transcription elongation factor GreA
MPNKKIFITSEGFLELESELKDLKLNKRAEVTQALKEARALGDLSENAEYDAALNEQEALEKRIKELEFTLEHAHIIEETENKDIVHVGATVKLQYVGEDDTEEYRIVGSQEADPFNNKISNESPIAAAVMNKKVGDIADVESPNGVYQVKIVSIS